MQDSLGRSESKTTQSFQPKRKEKLAASEKLSERRIGHRSETLLMVLDSGACDHVAVHEDLFVTIKEIAKGQAGIADYRTSDVHTKENDQSFL